MKMKKFSGVLLCIAMIVLGAISTVASADNYVAHFNKSGKQFTTLQAAINEVVNAADEEHIILDADITEDVVLNGTYIYKIYMNTHTLNGQIKIERGALTLHGCSAIHQGRGAITGGIHCISTEPNSAHIYIDTVDISDTSGDAIVMESSSLDLQLISDVTVNGNVVVKNGEFIVADDAENRVDGTITKENPGTVSLMGGCYTKDPSALLGNTKKAVYDDVNGVWTLETVTSATTIEDFAKDGEGAYLISSADELVIFHSELSAGGASTFEGKVFKLTNNIDLKGKVFVTTGNKNNRFGGTFDGQNNTLKNLVIDGEGRSYAGFFGSLGVNGTVKNVKVENASVTGGSYVGVLIGQSRSSSLVENCSVSGEIKVDATGSYVAGIIGHMQSANGIKNCSVTGKGTISGGAQVGGIVGAANNSGKVENNTVSDVAIEGNAAVGGIVGFLITNATEVSGNKVEDIEIEGNSGTGLVIGQILTNSNTVTVDNNTATESAINGKESNTVYGVIDGESIVAIVNSTPYGTLAAAIAGAQNGDTIDLLGNTLEVTSSATAKGMIAKGVTLQNGTMDFTNATTAPYDSLFPIGANQTIKFKDMTLLIKDREQSSDMCYWMDLLTTTATAYFENCFIDFDTVQYSYISANGDGKVYFKDCTIEAEENNFVYRAGATFENCTFDGFAGLSENESGANIILHAAVPCTIRNSTVSTRTLGSITANGTISIENSYVYAEKVSFYNEANNPNHPKKLITVDADSTLEAVEINMSLINEDASEGKITSEASSVYVQYKKTDVEDGEDNLEGADTYEIILAGANNAKAKEIINELASADLTFNFDGTPFNGAAMTYTVTPAKGATLSQIGDRYMFNYNGVDKYEESGAAIVIGTITVEGYGSYYLGTKDVTTNAVYATEIRDNIVDGFEAAGDLVINDNDAFDGMDGYYNDVTIAVPTRTLTINVTFPNAINPNAAAYQNMKVEITGNIEGKTQTVTYDLGETMTNGAYVVEEDRLVLNEAYAVTVSGAGYRTARYTVTMNCEEGKTLNFWNNVKDNETAIEEGKKTAKVTYLAGDIVKDNNINIYDLSAVVSYFGEEMDTDEYNAYAKYDLNRDGKIDSKDVAYVLVSWGN